MCCWTHGDPRYPGELAPGEEWRCQCGAGGVLVDTEGGKTDLGVPVCTRKATGEDLLCDVCRDGDDLRPVTTDEDRPQWEGGGVVQPPPLPAWGQAPVDPRTDFQASAEYMRKYWGGA